MVRTSYPVNLYDINSARRYVKEFRDSLILPDRQASYTISELALLFNCVETAARKFVFGAEIKVWHDLKNDDSEGITLVPHQEIVSYFRPRINGVKKDIESLLFQGLIKPMGFSIALGARIERIDSYCRNGTMPSIWFSSGDRRNYRIPSLEALMWLDAREKIQRPKLIEKKRDKQGLSVEPVSDSVLDRMSELSVREVIPLRLRQMRRSMSWLSEEIGVSREAVSKWVKGAYPPEEDKMPLIYDALGVPYKK